MKPDNLKLHIIDDLKRRQCVIGEQEVIISEQFIRGYIAGASRYANTVIPSHWYIEIIDAIREAEP